MRRRNPPLLIAANPPTSERELAIAVRALLDRMNTAAHAHRSEDVVRLLAEARALIDRWEAQLRHGLHTNPRGHCMSRDVHRIDYTHAEDGQDYTHAFEGHVTMHASADGRTITLHHAHGAPLAREFD